MLPDTPATCNASSGCRSIERAALCDGRAGKQKLRVVHFPATLPPANVVNVASHIAGLYNSPQHTSCRSPQRISYHCMPRLLQLNQKNNRVHVCMCYTSVCACMCYTSACVYVRTRVCVRACSLVACVCCSFSYVGVYA